MLSSVVVKSVSSCGVYWQKKMKLLRFLFTSKGPQTEESFEISVKRLELLSWNEDCIFLEMSVLKCRHTTLRHSCEDSDRSVTNSLKLPFWTALIFLLSFQCYVSETSSCFLISIRGKETWLLWVFSTAIPKPSFVNNFIFRSNAASYIFFLPSYSLYEANEPKFR
jgi:hypothetical protein